MIVNELQKKVGPGRMLTIQQRRSRIVTIWKATKKRVAVWWLMMSDTEQRDVMMRGVTVGAAAVAVSAFLPMISVSYEHQRAEADYRNQAVQLAELQDAGEVVRSAPYSSALLDHPWLVKVEYALERDPASALSRYAMRDRDGMALASVASFESRHLDKAEEVAADFKCLSQAVYYEAGNEPREGQLAVAEVIANRVRDHRYPNSVCEVVYQGATRTTGCQFTFTCDGALDRAPEAKRYARAEEVAAQVMMGLNEQRTNGATHYHATYVNPVWNAGLVRTTKIKTHIFYRFPRGSEWARVQRASAKAKPRTVKPSDKLNVIKTTALTTDDLNRRALSGAAAASSVAAP